MLPAANSIFKNNAKFYQAIAHTKRNKSIYQKADERINRNLKHFICFKRN